MSESVNTDYHLMLDIDALYDTRMGVLRCIEPQLGVTAVENGYHTRLWDDFETLTNGRLTNEVFKKAYADRNFDTIRMSIITGLPMVVQSYVRSLEGRMVRGVDVGKITITINTFPYNLPGPMREMIVTCLSVLLPEYVTVKHTRINMLQYPPEILNRVCDAWATYSFNPWLEKHHEALLEHRIPQFTVILPRLHLSAPRAVEVVEQGDETVNELDKLSGIAMVMEDFVHLEYLPVADFCYMTPGTYKVAGQSSSASSSSP